MIKCLAAFVSLFCAVSTAFPQGLLQVQEVRRASAYGYVHAEDFSDVDDDGFNIPASQQDASDSATATAGGSTSTVEVDAGNANPFNGQGCASDAETTVTLKAGPEGYVTSEGSGTGYYEKQFQVVGVPAAGKTFVIAGVIEVAADGDLMASASAGMEQSLSCSVMNGEMPDEVTVPYDVCGGIPDPWKPKADTGELTVYFKRAIAPGAKFWVYSSADAGTSSYESSTDPNQITLNGYADAYISISVIQVDNADIRMRDFKYRFDENGDIDGEPEVTDHGGSDCDEDDEYLISDYEDGDYEDGYGDYEDYEAGYEDYEGAY